MTTLALYLIAYTITIIISGVLIRHAIILDIRMDKKQLKETDISSFFFTMVMIFTPIVNIIWALLSVINLMNKHPKTKESAEKLFLKIFFVKDKENK